MNDFVGGEHLRTVRVFTAVGAEGLAARVAVVHVRPVALVAVRTWGILAVRDVDQLAH